MGYIKHIEKATGGDTHSAKYLLTEILHRIRSGSGVGARHKLTNEEWELVKKTGSNEESRELIAKIYKSRDEQIHFDLAGSQELGEWLAECIERLIAGESARKIFGYERPKRGNGADITKLKRDVVLVLKKRVLESEGIKTEAINKKLIEHTATIKGQRITTRQGIKNAIKNGEQFFKEYYPNIKWLTSTYAFNPVLAIRIIEGEIDHSQTYVRPNLEVLDELFNHYEDRGCN